MSRNTVREYFARATSADLTWPLADEPPDGALGDRLFAESDSKRGTRRQYGAAAPAATCYSRFAHFNRDSEHRLSPIMRRHHAAADKVFVDYSGKTVPIVGSKSGIHKP
jgi:transposase